ncbi:MAG: sulfotransferase [Candidatus Omnitrophica bacterium]|nr:sulfotransferase [Candidatus Omnitrophota bacterium]
MDPFFIIGTERSGTNLLRLILNAHSGIAIPHPPHIMKNFFSLEPLYGDLSVDTRFKRLISDVVKMVELHPYPWEVSIDRERIFYEAKQRDLINIFFAIYEQYRESTGKRRWGCKSTFMVYHVALIRHYYPRAQFIFMVRDGRDVAASARKTIFNRYNVYYTANLWKKEQQLGISWLRRLSGDNICLVKYEDILSRPTETVQSLCSFLHEPYEENMLNFFSTQEARKSGGLSAAWKNTSSPILKDNCGKFKIELKPREIRLFESIACHELNCFSYDLCRPLHILEGINARGVKFKIRYFIEEIFYMITVQLKHLCTDKNSMLRIKKYWFLKLVRIIRAIQ